MYTLCTICTDIMSPLAEINVTKCGHLFHSHCLEKWIQRSNTCPQCRKRTTLTSVFRLYPTLSSQVEENETTLLQSCLDDAQIQINEQKALCQEKDDELNELTEVVQKNENVLKDYKERVRSFERNETLRILAKENEMLRSNVEMMSVYRNNLSDKLIEYEKTISKLDKEIKLIPGLEGINSRLNYEIDSLNKYVQSLGCKLEEAKTKVLTQTSTITSLTEQLKTLPSIELEQENKKLKKHIEALDGIINFLNKKLASSDTAVIILKKRLDRIQTSKREDIERLKKRIQDLNRRALERDFIHKKMKLSCKKRMHIQKPKNGESMAGSSRIPKKRVNVNPNRRNIDSRPYSTRSTTKRTQTHENCQLCFSS